MYRIHLSLLALVPIGILGCGTGDGSNDGTVPANVRVMYEGQPVQGANLTFVPANSSNAHASGNSGTTSQGAVGTTNDKGEVAMWTFEPGKGVTPGSYHVGIRKLEVLSLPDPESVSPEEYAKRSKELDAALKGPSKHLLPEKFSRAKTSGLTAEVVEGEENQFLFDLSK
ncbi:MAG: hypothetical protein WDZ51_14480 [Pirellulaceae bacterium]